MPFGIRFIAGSLSPAQNKQNTILHTTHLPILTVQLRPRQPT
jgi:hypothetical protein